MKPYAPLTAAGVAILLIATNPTTDEFASWFRNKALNSAPANDQQLGKAIVALFGDQLIASGTTRINLLFFSIFATQLEPGNRVFTLGFLRIFVPLPDAPPAASQPPAAHVVPASTPGQWLPQDGYVWVVDPPQPGDFRVRWAVGRASAKFAHTVTASTEGNWLPEDGYAWVVDPPTPGDMRVRWSPASLSSLHAHVVAAPAEGRWLPADGYAWVASPPSPGDFRVRWEVGKPSTMHQHVISAPAEGRWLPEPGYRWINEPPPPGDFRVKLIGL